MKKILTIICLIFILSLGIQAKVPKYLLNKAVISKDDGDLQNQSIYKPPFKRNYDVKSYSLNFDWVDMLNQTKKEWSGISSIKLITLADTISQIVMDAGYLQINSVEFEEKNINFTHNEENSELIIYLNRKVNKGEELELIISFKDNSFDNVGVNFYAKGIPNSNVYENIAYTMSEPKDARHWIPCNDIPIDRALLDVKIKVPAGYTALSNGELVESTLESNSAIFHWKHNFEIPTYLMAITASIFYEDKDSVKLASGKIIEMPYYYWKELIPTDSSYIPVTRLHSNMMKFFSDVFFEYPYEKYSVVFVPEFLGGMEHNTITTVDLKWKGDNYSDGFAHELAHHWLGNYITCADWQDLWINEGGATWAAAIWMEHYFGSSEFKSEILKNSNGVLHAPLSLPGIYDLPDEYLFNWSLTYAKSSIVYQMISEIVGREKFYKTLRKIFSKHPLESITTEQFIEVVKQENSDSKVNWDKFFEQWLVKRAYPIYDISIDFEKLKEDSDSTIAKIKIKQTQSGHNIPEAFEMPVPFIFTKQVNINSQIHINKSYYMNLREQEFIDTLEFSPNYIETDFYKLLHKSSIDKAYIKPDSKDEKIFIYPNIASAGSNLNIDIVSAIITEDIHIAIYNQLGENIHEFSISDNLGIYTLDLPLNISPGMYYLKFEFNNKKFIQKLIIK